MSFQKIIILTIFACFAASPTSQSNSDTGECRAFKSCQPCATRPYCGWSLTRQTCVDASQTPDAKTVNGSANCPRYSVENDAAFLHQRYYSYKVTVSNDAYGFVDFLAGTEVRCKYVEVMLNKTTSFRGRVSGSAIVCDRTRLDDFSMIRKFRGQPLYVFQCVVSFADGVALRLDPPSAGFFGVYASGPNGKCRAADRDADCLTCAWDDAEYTDYMRRCLATNPCVGQFGVYTRVYSGNHTTAQTPLTAAPACPDDLAVVDVRPTRAPWYGRVNVTVAVKNHRIMYNGTNVFVTVAGRECARPRTAGADVIQCTVDSPAAAAVTGQGPWPRGGPVQVRYALLRSYVLTSEQRFEWTYPEVTAVRVACDDAAALTVEGVGFASARDVRVQTDGADRTCDVISRTDDRIVCRRTGPAHEPVRGRVTVTLDGESFGAPVRGVPALDAGQTFAGIASGGTSLPVRGTGFACARRPRVYAEPRDAACGGAPAECGRVHAECRVVNDTYMACRSPRSPWRSGAARRTPAEPVSRFGVVVDFAGEPLDLSPAGPDAYPYTSYPDPQFAGFQVTDGATAAATVVLRGDDLGSGFGPDDVRVRSTTNSTDDLCAVTLMTRDRVECAPPPTSAAVADDLREVVVSVGDVYSVTVRTLETVDESAARAGSSGAVVIYAGVIFVVFTATLSLCLAYSYSKKKASYRVSPEQLVDFKNTTDVNAEDVKS